MAAERDMDLLDDYLANRLDPAGRSAFEQKLAVDPSLKAELELQQQFIQGIRKARAAELKAFMNNIPVPASTTGALGAGKIAASVLIAGALGTALYFALKPDAPSAPTNIEQQKGADSSETPSNETAENVVSPETEESPEVPSEKSASEAAPVKGPKTLDKNKVKPAPSNPKVEVYDPTEEQNEPVEDIENLGIPRSEETPSLSVKIQNNKRYGFHYQFVDGQLILFGPFEDNLYEIMEFFNEERKTTFLVHKDQYYHLKDGDNQIKPLVTIKDLALIKRLKEYRAQ